MIIQELRPFGDWATSTVGSEQAALGEARRFESQAALSPSVDTATSIVYVPASIANAEDADLHALAQASMEALDTWSLENDF